MLYGCICKLTNPRISVRDKLLPLPVDTSKQKTATETDDNHICKLILGNLRVFLEPCVLLARTGLSCETYESGERKLREKEICRFLIFPYFP